MGIISWYYRTFEKVVPGYSAPDSIINRTVDELDDPPEDWPPDAQAARMKEGREMFGSCPACGADAIWAKEAVTRGGSEAECKSCDFKLTSVSGLGSGQEEFECVAGPDELRGETNAQETWKNMDGIAVE
ncbi:hypothetical protein [Natrinema pallidum]|uniref:Uncharacterized protein n=1 Tax=Natrinema pallidum TaxID=69527 RepID=A0A4P9TFJ2_9EURY|nr:hypothetical protein [Natrinema pallidum]QCW03586.1 hypothetical protein FGF80_10180 [Natrinema pallidum]